jgi:hypothetical protein
MTKFDASILSIESIQQTIYLPFGSLINSFGLDLEKMV